MRYVLCKKHSRIPDTIPVGDGCTSQIHPAHRSPYLERVVVVAAAVVVVVVVVDVGKKIVSLR
jgi:hypothetical protein